MQFMLRSRFFLPEDRKKIHELFDDYDHVVPSMGKFLLRSVAWDFFWFDTDTKTYTHHDIGGISTVLRRNLQSDHPFFVVPIECNVSLFQPETWYPGVVYDSPTSYKGLLAMLEGKLCYPSETVRRF